MTNPGEDAGQTASSDSSTGSSEPSSSGYEAPPIEQSQEQPAPSQETPQAPEQPRYTPPPAYAPAEHAAVGARATGLSAAELPAATAIRHPGATRLPAAALSGPPVSARRLPAAVIPPASAVRRAAARVRPTADRLPRPGLRRPYGQPAQKTNSMAIASLVASLIGFAVLPRLDRRHRARHRCDEPDQADPRRRPWIGDRRHRHRRGIAACQPRLDARPYRQLTMTTSGPDQPEPFRGTEYPSLENAAPQPDPNAAGRLSGRRRVAAAGVSAAVSRSAGLSAASPATTRRRLRPVPADQAARHERHGDRSAGHVAGIGADLCCGMPSFVGVILGIVAMRETKRTGQDGLRVGTRRRHRRRHPVTGFGCCTCSSSIGIFASGWQWAP